MRARLGCDRRVSPFFLRGYPFEGLARGRLLRFVHKFILFLMLFLFVTCGRTEAELKPGDLAPDFSLPGSDGRTYSLADYRGKQIVVLAWFPKAFTGG